MQFLRRKRFTFDTGEKNKISQDAKNGMLRSGVVNSEQQNNASPKC